MRRQVPGLRATTPNPQRHTGRRLQPGERVGVDEHPPPEDVADRRPIQLGPPSEPADRLALGVEEVTETAGNTDELDDTLGSIGNDCSVDEVADDMVTRAAGPARGTGHHPTTYHDTDVTDWQYPLTNTCSIDLDGVSKPRSGDAETAMAVTRSAGTATHKVIAGALTALASDGDPIGRIELAGPVDLVALAHAAHNPTVTGPMRASVRISASTNANKYLTRCTPTGWHLIGCEVRLDGAIADVVWEHPNGRVFIDEIKTGVAGRDVPDVVDQLTRLVRAGKGRWGTRFVGVRHLPLATPRYATVWTFDPADVLTPAVLEGVTIR